MITKRERVLVNNRTGHKYSGAQFLDFWEKETDSVAIECARIGCDNIPTNGGHVYKVGSGPHPHWYIVPLCDSCNQKFFPKGYFVFSDDMVDALYQD